METAGAAMAAPERRMNCVANGPLNGRSTIRFLVNYLRYPLSLVSTIAAPAVTSRCSVAAPICMVTLMLILLPTWREMPD
jgi:hypothetical protein